MKRFLDIMATLIVLLTLLGSVVLIGAGIGVAVIYVPLIRYTLLVFVVLMWAARRVVVMTAEDGQTPAHY